YYVRCQFAPDQTACAASFDPVTSSSELATVVGDVEAGRIGYDGTAAETCLKAIGDAPCNSTKLSVTDACEHMFTGRVATGGACFFDLQCTSLQCERTDSCSAECCPGTCMAAPPPVPIGGDCSAGQKCVESAHCSAGVCSAAMTGPGTSC